MKTIVLSFALTILAISAIAADSQSLKEFKQMYGALDFDLLSQPVEVATVSNFVYTKELATFTFANGKFYLARPVMGRPTTAFFIGSGKCDITVPSHAERVNLWYTCGDSAVHESFQVCFIRIADDLDLKLREKFTFAATTLDWKDYNIATKQAQGEYFFRPILGHEQDNYFELLRSCLERNTDGYFWADFNRFTYCFDPNRPEEIKVGYEKYPNDLMVTEGVSCRRASAGISDDRGLSNEWYETKTVSRATELTMGGPDGNSLDHAVCDLKLIVLRDSLKYTTFYLNGTLKDDSILFENKPLDYHRRDNFPVVGVILPRYVHRGDTITIQMHYHGAQYAQAVPFIDNPAAAPIHVAFTSDKGNDYLTAGIATPPVIEKGKSKIVAAPTEPYRWFYFKGHVGGYTPIAATTQGGRQVTFLKSKDLNKSNYEFFVTDETFQPPVLAALDYFAARFGDFRGAQSLTIFPLEGPSMPGLACISQVKDIRPGSGGIHLDAGIEVSKQWFGNLMQIASPRETWITESAPYYLGTMFLTSQTPPLQQGTFFSELLGQRDVIYTQVGLGKDQPLSAGERVPVQLRVTKGSWVFHMLRYLMFDIEKNSDRAFLRFMNDLSHQADTVPITTASFEKLAEQYYGKPLGWFFDEWVYGRNIPTFVSKYTTVSDGGDWNINVSVAAKDMLPSFTMPIICRVNFEDGTTTLVRQTINAGANEFTVGPFDKKPSEFVFNEYFSALGHE